MPDRGIELRHIRYVIAAADHGSFRRAGMALRVQESAISRRIRDLELRLGATLFTRSAGGVQLTHAGKQFVQRGRQAIAQIGIAGSEIRAIGRGDVGEVRVGIFSSVGEGFLADVIQAFEASNSAVQLIFSDGDPAEHVAAIRQLKLDIAFVAGWAEWAGCSAEHLWSERMFVAFPARHRLAAGGDIGWGDIAGEKFVVSDMAPGKQAHDHLLQRLAGHRQTPVIEHHDVGRFNLLSLVALGRGLTLTSECIANMAFPGIRFRAIEADAVPYSAVWSPENDNPAFKRFLALARSMASVNSEPIFSFLRPQDDHAEREQILDRSP